MASPRSGPLGAEPVADVALVLEGTWPYAIGGVSTWVDGLVRGLPDVRFGVVHLYAGGAPGPARLAVPENVVWRRDLGLPGDLASVDPEALARAVPPARLVHALSTGFAGLVGAEVRRQRGVPFVVTEHGVYWHEVAQGAPELETGLRLVGVDASGGNPCASRAGWVARFQDYARTAYAAADVVTTVTEANRALQAELGFDGALVVPNGVPPPVGEGPLGAQELARLDPSARLAAAFRVGFVGRVTPLKDVRALVRAFARMATPGARLHLVGPADDPGYAAGCRALAARPRRGRPRPRDGRPAGGPVVAPRRRGGLGQSERGRAPRAPGGHGRRRPGRGADVGGVRALVTGGDGPPAGLVLEASSDLAGPLAAALDRLAASPALRARLGAAGRQRAAGRSVAAVAERYGALYRGLGMVASGPASPQ